MSKVLLAFIIAACPVLALAQPTICPIPGEPIQWIADYCMAKGETDDLEAVSPCINASSRLQFRSACIAKLHFKRLLCQATLASHPGYRTLEACVQDPGFIGPTVKAHGHGA